MSRRFFSVLIIGWSLVYSFTCWASLENLDEINNRKARQSTNTFYSGEESSAPYYRQPMTLRYADITTGAEVWRMSTTTGIDLYYYQDIGISPWSADGK